MSFGKRQPRQDAPAAVRITRPTPPRPPQGGAPKNRMNVPLLAGVAAGFALIAIIYSGYMFGMRQLGQALDAKFEAQVAETIHPTPQHALLNGARADGWSFGHCNMRPPPSAVDSVVPGAYAERDASNPMLEHMGGDFSIALVNSANFIACVADYETHSLCAAPERTAFATDVARFYREHDALAFQFAQNRAPTDEKFAAVMASLEDAGAGFGETGNVVDRELAMAKASVDDALSKVAAAGYVSSTDFGWFPPAAVAEVLAKAREAAANGAGGHRSACPLP